MVGAIIDLFVIPEMVRVENLSRKLLQQAQGGWEPQSRPGACCG